MPLRPRPNLSRRSENGIVWSVSGNESCDRFGRMDARCANNGMAGLTSVRDGRSSDRQLRGRGALSAHGLYQEKRQACPVASASRRLDAS